MAYSTRKTLLKQILSGDEIAWREFYERYYRLIISIGKRWNLPDDKCHDLVQQVMLAVFQKQLTFRYQPELGKFRAFLIGVTRNVILNMKRSDAIRCMREADAQKEIAEESDQIFDEEWRNYLLDMMLDELRQTVEASTFDTFQMYVLQNIRPEKISKALGISIASVYVYKKRCLEHLKRSYELLQKSDPDFHI